jgi:hypothetical protein
VYAIDPDRGPWETLSPLPRARGHASGGIAAGRVYTVGGTDERWALATADAYLPERETESNEPWRGSSLSFGIGRWGRTGCLSDTIDASRVTISSMVVWPSQHNPADDTRRDD